MAITDIVVSGKLYTDSGDAVNGATVALLETGTSTQEASTTTDSNGAWSFTETSLDATYDVKFTQGSSVRYILWSDEIALKGVDTASLKVRGVEGAAAPIYLFADQADDAGDAWRIQASASDTLAIGSDKASAGTIIDYITITNGANAAASVVALGGDLTVGDALSLTAASAVFNMGAGNDFTITHDGTEGATIAGNPLTLDSGGDITLDAEDADIFLKDGGTLFGTLTNSSGELVIKSSSSGTTAATFAGANVTFAGTVDATTDFTVGSTVITDDSIVMTPSTSDTVTIAGATHGILNVTTVDAAGTAADVNIDADGEIVLDAADAAGTIFKIAGTAQLSVIDGAILPTTDNDIDLGSSSYQFKDAHINGTLEADAITIGGTNVVTGSLITTLGTISAGVWEGTDVAVAHGGTGASSLTDGGVLLGSGTSAVTAMAVLADSEMIVGDGTTDPVAESGATLRTSIGVGTGDSPQFTAIELGHASDTTIARSGSGAITVEGTQVLLAGAALTGSTIDASTDFTIGDTVITDGVITDTSGLSIAAAVDLGANTLTSTGSMQIRTIDYSDGDNAMTIADGGGVTFPQATTFSSGITIGAGGNEFSITESSDDITIKSLISDKDLKISGNDGGSNVDALSFDMSDAGAATFNGKVGVGVSPAALLHVSDAYSGTPTDGIDSNVTMLVSDTGTWMHMQLLSSNSTGSTIRFGDVDNTDDGVIAYLQGDNEFQFKTNGDTTAVMTIGSDGTLDLSNYALHNVGNASNQWDSTSLINVSGIYSHGTGNAQVQSRVVNTQNVANSATKIAELTVDTTTGGAMVYVMGAMSGDDGESWMDVVILGSNAHTVLHTFTARGSSSDARTYTHNSSGDLFVEMADTTTYDITTYMMEFGSPR